MPAGFRMESHVHDWPQLIFAVRRVITVSADGGNWVVPPMRGLWVPAGIRHSLHMAGTVAMRTLYLDPALPLGFADSCCVIEVVPLLRELIVSIVSVGGLRDDGPTDRARLTLLLELLSGRPAQPLALPMPKDQRARSVAERVLADLRSTLTLDEWSRGSGASGRTIDRLFRTDTGMAFGRWRQQARLLEAIRLLGLSVAVTEVALRVGYRSPSAFVAAFRRSMGKTPAAYIRG